MALALVKFASMSEAFLLPVDACSGAVIVDGRDVALDELVLDAPITGTVYGTLLNTRSQYALLEAHMQEPPYNKPPAAPALYIKPRNTLAGFGSDIVSPANDQGVRIEGGLGLVIGKAASRLTAANALEHVWGYTIVCDATVPHEAYFRPSTKFRCRDGYCPIGPWVIEKGALGNPDCIEIRTVVDGVTVCVENTRDLLRSTAQLLADVTEFMTLDVGDVLLVGSSGNAPVVKPGQTVAIEISGIGCLRSKIIAEAQQMSGGCNETR